MKKKENTYEKFRDFILDEYKKGNIVVSTFEGFKVGSIKNVLDQPIEGLLYDLNRDEATILTFIEDQKWINDYAMMIVLKELKYQNEILTEKLQNER